MEFKGTNFNVDKPISVHEFIEKSKQIEIFNVLMIREVAKKTMHISDHNPRINREAMM